MATDTKHQPQQHHRDTVAGFVLEDTTHTDPAYKRGELIWVGHDSQAGGNWLTNQEAMALATALMTMVRAQNIRVAKQGCAR